MKTEILDARSDAALPAAIATAVAALRRGEVVAIPTETVYGLAALPSAEATLRATKERDEGKPFTWAFASRADAAKLVALDARGPAKLSARFWPGPLTLVLPRREGSGTLGVRVPAHKAALELLAAIGEPLLLSSANRSGEPDAKDAEEVKRALDGRVGFVLDGGRSKLGEPSAVVSFAGARPILHREGIIDRAMIVRVAARNVLFVCSGNTCRSPMAEALLRAKWAAKLGIAPTDLPDHGGIVASAGTGALAGMRASEEAIDLLAERKIDLRSHRSRTFTAELGREADDLWVMTRAHAEIAAQRAPAAAAKIELLDLDGRDITDPIGAGPSAYRKSLAQIERAIDARLPGLL